MERPRELDVDSNSFDYIRMICACTIFLGHCLTHFKFENIAFLNRMAYFIRGVPVFFYLSGFFCARSLERYGSKLFIKKRCIRIYPALWVCLMFNTVIILITYPIKPSLKEFLIYVGTQFSFFQFYTGDWLRKYGVSTPNGALWTISTEIQFYIVILLIAGYCKKWTMKQWVSLVSLSAVAALILGHCEKMLPGIIDKLLKVSIIPFIYIFLFGMMCFYYKNKIVPYLADKWFPISMIYVVWSLLPSQIADFVGGGVRYNVITTILLMLLVMSVGYRLGKHRVKYEISYHFYLYHMVVINFIVYNVTDKAIGIGQFIELFAVSFFLTVILAILSYRVANYIAFKFSLGK